ncbi:MAG: methylmalonyl-CoA carboxyltransferase [candidate division Zixibacteria bacterium HGW-Zixibacteria-1]|nr:MAG: methylmalonyl-CoA carboxyltransferase [candidate division Zixibacteria bacterium HGW-Zixibacteria-1]
MAESKIDRLRKKRNKLVQGGGEKRIAKQHELGKLTTRERLGLLYDADSFRESLLYMKHRCTHFEMADKEYPGEGVITGIGFVDNRPVYAASQDFTVAGGSVGEATGRKIQEAMDAALKTGDPFIMINDSGGARIQEGVDSLSAYGGIFYRNVLLSGVVPQISIIAGPCAGGAAYSPALTDFIIQVRHEGQLYITGPLVIKQVTGEDISAEQLGGVESHAHYSGVVHFIAEDDEDAINITKRLLSFLPSNNTEDPPFIAELHDEILVPDESMNNIVPDDSSEPYDMHDIITRFVDNGDFMEVQEHFAPNILIGFGRLTGYTIGIVANQPMHKAGVLDIDSSDKASRFIRFCNAFNIPIVTFVDVPGFMPGVKQEYGGIIRHGAKMLFAYAAATVPKITVVVRKAYGGAYLAMCAKSMGADTLVAWPMAEIAVMGAEGAVSVLYRKEIADAADPKAEMAKKLEEYKDAFANPYFAASRGLVDEILEPADTRPYLAACLEVLKAKRELRPQKKHGLIPL